MKSLKFEKQVPSQLSPTPKAKSSLWKSIGCIGILILFIAMSDQITLSSLDPKLPRPSPEPETQSFMQEPTVGYPDSFGFRSEYLTQFTIKHRIVHQGDNLYKIFQELDLPTECLAQWQKNRDEACELNQLKPGDELTIYTRHQDQEPVKLVYSATNGVTYTLRKSGSEWSFQEEETEPISITQSVRGVITDTLYDSCLREGLPPKAIMDLADLFAYDIDFTTDLRQGDTFAVYFRQEVKNGKRIHVDSILAAEMRIKGEVHQAFYFRQPDGHEDYYDTNGRSLRKLFLKAPLQYSRISSQFTHSRFHPILKIYRPHLGIDYSAPTGTPVSALGDGTITFLGTQSGYGRFIEITHSSSLKTTYGHLSGYAQRLKTGSKVKQGEVIGYVGSSGLATGPHLDFRFYKDGRPIDFLKTNFPFTREIPQSLQAEFKQKYSMYLAALREDKRLALKEN